MKNLKEKHKVHNEAINSLYDQYQELDRIIQLTSSHLFKGKLILAGNGGSAADAQHVAAELTGRFKIERNALPAIALTVDTSAITAIGNDFGFENIFTRQFEAIRCSEDLLWIFSTSGNSKNLVTLTKSAKQYGLKVVGFLGCNGGVLKPLVDHSIIVNSDQTDIIQEIHIFLNEFSNSK